MAHDKFAFAFRVLGDRLEVTFDDGSKTAYSLPDLARQWRSMTNDAFYDRYGFEWPSEAGHPLHYLPKD